MCRNNKITYLICLHSVSQTHTCHTFHRFFFGRCQKISESEVFINDYCPRCRIFWDHHHTSEESRRERATEFRKEAGYHGAITPSAVPCASAVGKGFFFGFVKDEDEGVRGTGQVKMDEVKSTRKGGGDEEASSSISDMMRNKGKRRESVDSAGTVWPTATQVGGKKNGDESRRLGPDDFGNDSDVASNWSRGEGVITPEDFNLKNLETQLCGSEEEQRTEKGAVRLKAVAPMPGVTLQGRGTVDDRSLAGTTSRDF